MWLIKVMAGMLALLYSAFTYAAFSPPTIATQGMVVSDHYLASAVGAEVLKQGGNAMDAAVAVGYALAVVHPCCGNIGGGGFMLIHWHDGRDIVLDFREVAPEKIRAALFFDKDGHLKKNGELGYLFVGVPGTVMGLNTALEKLGTWPLQRVLAPAIRLAKNGFVLNQYDVKNFARVNHEISLQENLKAIFMPNGQMLKPGQKFIQKNLANTLEKIGQGGTKRFYEGDIARTLVKASDQDHGVLSLEDFKNYRVIWRKPIGCEYRGYQLLSAPPPSSGVTVCEILQIVSGFPLADLGFHSAAALHFNVAAMKQAFYDRNHYLGDPDFVSNPVDWILSQERIHEIQRHIVNDTMINPKKFRQTKQHMHTTHYVVMDNLKNVVATTYTINSFFGSLRVAGDSGFLLNNELRDFALKKNHPNLFHLVHGKANLIAPNKRPLSSMSPTLVMKNKEVYLALGAAGGPTIITSIVEAIENVIDYGMDIRAANDSPRYHMQWLPNVVYWEPFGFSNDTVQLLRDMGYEVRQNLFDKYLYWGQMNSILVEQGGVITGASDNRQPNGRAVGVKQVGHASLHDDTFAANL